MVALMITGSFIFGLHAMKPGATMDAFKIFGREDIEAKRGMSLRIFESHLGELIAQKSQEEYPLFTVEDGEALLNLFEGIQHDMGNVTHLIRLLLAFHGHVGDFVSDYRGALKQTFAEQGRMSEYASHNDEFEQIGSQLGCFIARCFHAYSRAHLFSPLETMITLPEEVRARIIHNTIDSVQDSDMSL